MALNKIKLKSDIKSAFSKAASETENQDAVMEALAASIADAVDQFVKGLQITYVPADPLNPPPAPFVAGIYPVTGTFSYTLS